MGNQNVTNVSARVAARVPLDLAEWVAAQPYSQSELVVRALRALRDGPPAGAALDGHLVPELQSRVTDAVATKRVPIDHHPAGPVLPPTINVRGEASPFFRPGTNADKATKA